MHRKGKKAAIGENPKVSVIIPFYNRRKHIRACVRSVLDSTLADIEIICVDDGSTDGTTQAIHRLARQDSRITVVESGHGGAYEARWRGLEQARGEYVHFMDSDDLIVPNAYEELYSLCKESNLDQIVFTAEPFNADNHTQSEKLVKEGFDKHYHLDPECCGKVMEGRSLFESLSRHKSFFVGFPMRMLRRDMLVSRDLPLCNAIWHADNFYTVMWMYWSNAAMAIDRKYYKRRVHKASITMKTDEDEIHARCILSVMSSLCSFLPFREKSGIKGTPEANYMLRLKRGLDKRLARIKNPGIVGSLRKLLETTIP